MKQIEAISNSFELFKLINEHRVLHGKKPMKYHRDLVVKMKDELGVEYCVRKKTQPINFESGKGKVDTFDAYELNRQDVFLVSMRESKEVRKSIYHYIEELEARVFFLESKWMNYAETTPREVCGMLGCEHTMVFLDMITNDYSVQKQLLEQGVLKTRKYGNDFEKAYLETFGKPLTAKLLFTKHGKEWFKRNKEVINTRLLSRKNGTLKDL